MCCFYLSLKRKKMPLKILHIDKTCTGCGACISSCSQDALKLIYDSEGFYYPSLDASKCIDCKLCEKNCHVLNPLPQKEPIDYIAYMGKSKSEEIRKNSSSGGFFTLLANSIIGKGGVVFGARYNYEKERLEQADTDHVAFSELPKSKYIESYMGDSFKTIKNYLKEDRYVMYCGTPCQISGLRTYLKQVDQTKLLVVDFICHGVPSNKNFTAYKHFLEKKEKSKLVHIDFRPKTKGWRTSNILLKFENHHIKDIIYTLSYYYRHFQNNDLLRKSCYTCTYPQRHLSDITIADFWGIYKYKSFMYDNKGLSLIIVNNQKGGDYVAQLKALCEIEELSHSAVQYAYNRNTTSYSNTKRSILSKKIIKDGFIPTMRHLYLKQIIYLKIRNFAGNVLRKIKIRK